MSNRIRSSLNSLDQPELAATLLRIALGAVFVAHAYAKAAVFTFPGTVQFFESHGFPGWTVYPVFTAELLGGIALILGVQTRLVALALIPILVGALKPHLGNGWMFTNPGGGFEYVLFLLVALGAQVLLGDGAYALRLRGPTAGGATWARWREHASAGSLEP